jgi:hypothetical protein
MGILNFLSLKKCLSEAENVQTGATAGARSLIDPKKQQAPAPRFRTAVMDMESYLASDEKEWLCYLGRAIRAYRKPGLTLKEEHAIWRKARTASRPSAPPWEAKVS